MHAVLLACCLGAAQAPDRDPLLKQLDADFEALLKKERAPEPLREAARLLALTDQSSNWTAYHKATALLRRTRSKAAIPLLLAYLVRHGHFGSNTGATADYLATLELLTGKEGFVFDANVTDRGKAVRATVERLVKDWWQPNREQITTDLGKMTDDQVAVVTERLLTEARAGRRTTFTAEDVHPRMLAVILARTGYRDAREASQPPRREAHPIPQEAVPILAALRKDAEAPALDKIAADERQNSATRLLCLLALADAGEAVPLPTLLGILAKEKRLDRRVLTIGMIGTHPDIRKASPTLVALLDDPNVYVRKAALAALSDLAPPEALPKLRRILAEVNPPESVPTALAVLAKIGTAKAKEALVTFLEGAIEDGRRGAYLSAALSAFETATGQSWTNAGAQTNAYYRRQARAALAWWRQQQKAGNPD